MHFSVCLAAILVASCSAVAPPAGQDPICTIRNEYVAIDGNCDTYVECRDYHAFDRICPDGLHYNADTKWPDYPCGYPSDVPCKGRGISQPAQSTPDCPHQFGFFASPKTSPTDCGHYIMCAAGLSHEMYCPPGLAYNDEISRCDWPENVPSCKAANFLGFECPPASYDDSGYPIITNHKSENSCYEFFMCLSGNARLLSCDPGFAFDEASEHCVDEDIVPCARSNVPTPTSQ